MHAYARPPTSKLASLAKMYTSALTPRTHKQRSQKEIPFPNHHFSDFLSSKSLKSTMKFSTAALVILGATLGSAFVPSTPTRASFAMRAPLQMSTEAAEPETYE